MTCGAAVLLDWIAPRLGGRIRLMKSVDYGDELEAHEMLSRRKLVMVLFHE